MKRRARRPSNNEIHHLSVYDGQHLLGHVVERGRVCTATAWPSGRKLGSFSTRKQAVAAIERAGAEKGGAA
jgi:hypothetical protein